jgi:hypothetical protein
MPGSNAPTPRCRRRSSSQACSAYQQRAAPRALGIRAAQRAQEAANRRVPSVARPHRRSGRSIAAGGAAHLTRKVGLCTEGCKDTTTWGGSLRTDGVRCAPLEGRSTGKDKEGGEHRCVLRETRMAGEERYGVISLPTCICVGAAWSDGRRRADGRKREPQGNLI